jgi:hypothetical protein
MEKLMKMRRRRMRMRMKVGLIPAVQSSSVKKFGEDVCPLELDPTEDKTFLVPAFYPNFLSH